MNKKEVIKEILKYYLITRVFLITLLIVDNFLLKIKFPNIESVFYLWDGEHYLNIANNGYISDYLYAFFPTIPLLIRYLGKIGFLLLNQICVILTSYLLYEIGNKHLKLKNTYSPVFFWLISPISVTTMLYYTEAIFLFLTTLTYYLYKEKKYFFVTGLVLGLCSTIRSTGSILFFSLFIIMVIDWIKKKIKFKNIITTFIPATIISCTYPIYLYYITGNPFKFIEVQQYWLKKSSNIIRLLYDVLIQTINDYKLIWAINSILTILLLYYLIRYIIKNRREKKYSNFFIYTLLTIFMLSFTIKGNGDPLTSYYRYIFACFPIYFMFKDEFKYYMIIGSASILISNFFLLNLYFF